MKGIVIIGKISGIALMLLGLVHDIFTFTPFIQEGMTFMPYESRSAAIYMSIVCGTSFIFIGLIFLLLLDKLGGNAFLTLPIVITGWFAGFCGGLAPVFMPGNPFAYIGMVFGLSIFGVSLLLNYKVFRDKKQV